MVCASHPEPSRTRSLNETSAIAFCYFETLLRLGNQNKIIAEETRLKSLNNLLNAVGFQQHLYEDFVESTLGLLEQIRTTVPVQDDGAALWASFNDPEISSGIITHFRVCWRVNPDISFYTATRRPVYLFEIQCNDQNL